MPGGHERHALDLYVPGGARPTALALRDDAVAARGPATDFIVGTVIAAMVGRTLHRLHPARRGTLASDPVLDARGIRQPEVVRVGGGRRRQVAGSAEPAR